MMIYNNMWSTSMQVRAVFGKDPRQYSIMTSKFLGDETGHVRGLVTVGVELTKQGIKVTTNYRMDLCDS